MRKNRNNSPQPQHTANATFDVTLNTIWNTAGSWKWVLKQPCEPMTAIKWRSLAKQLTTLDLRRIELCKKYGTINPETNEYVFPPDTYPIFEAEYTEMSKELITIESKQIKVNELPCAVSPMMLADLEWLIVINNG